MTNSVFLCYASNAQLGKNLVNGVVCVLVNAATSADALLNAALAANVAFKVTENQSEANGGLPDVFGPKYFDTAAGAGAVAGSGNMSADGDAYVMPERANPIFVAGSGYTPVG